MSNLKPIQISRCVSHLYPGLVSSASRSQNSCISSFNVLSLLHPGQEKCQSTQSSPKSNSFWSQDVCFTSIHFLSHLHSVSYSCIPPPSPSCLTSVQVMLFLSLMQVGSNLHSGGEACSSAPSMVYLTPPRSQDMHLTSIHILSHPIQVPRFASHLHSG